MIKIWLLGALLTFLLAWFAQVRNKEFLQTRIDNLSQSVEQLVKKRFEQYEYGLLGLRGALLAVDIKQIKRLNFERYINSRDLPREFPGALGFGFVRIVAPSFEAKFIAQARADDKPNFRIRTINAHQNERFIIQYIYPEKNNQGATGLDIGSETSFRQAALSAARDGESKLTAPTTLLKAKGNKQSSFLNLLPIYDSTLPQSSPEARLKAILGWVYAPLLVDEVLSDLGPMLREISVTLTDKTEKKPFFTTFMTDELKDAEYFSAKRSIQFMGRQWLLETHSLPEMSVALGIISPIWVVVLGLVLTILFTLLAMGIVKSGTNQILLTNNNSIGIRQFLNSNLFKKLILVYGILTVFVFGLRLLSSLHQEYQSTSDSLTSYVQRSMKFIQSQYQNYHEDLTFLQSTIVTSGILQAANSVSNVELDQPLEHWKGRLAEVFNAYMLSSPDVYQLRLIRANPSAQELIRIERRADKIYLVPENELQFKKVSSHVENLLTFDANEIWTSGLMLNVEGEVIEKPLRPTLRFSTSILNKDGTPFGTIIINVEATPVFAKLHALKLPDEVVYAINDTGDFVLHPNAANTFRSDFGEHYGWDDEFTPIASPFGLKDSAIKMWKGPQGDILSAQGNFSPNVGDESGQLTFNVTFLEKLIYQKVMLNLSKLVQPFINISVLSLLIMYLFWIETKRKRITAATILALKTQRRNDDMFRSLTELSPEAMIIADTYGQITLVNSQAENLFGHARKDMLGQNISMLVPKSTAASHQEYVRKIINQSDFQPIEKNDALFGYHLDGSEFPVEVSFSPMQLDDRLLIAASVRNISEQQRIEHSLRKATSEATRANQAKSAFLTNMSHETKTPLNAVIGLTDLLGNSNLDAEQRNLVDKVQLSGRSLLGIVNDVLDLAKIEANEIELNEAPCQLHELLKGLQGVFSAQAVSKGLKLQLTLAPNIPNYVNTDAKLLRQTLSNLLGNAIKFTQQGHIVLSAKVIESDPLTPSLIKVYFEVSDTGIGIDKDVQASIFQPFSQADSNTNRRFGGTGLGLSIVSSMVELLQGELGMQSTLKKGSQFWLILPMTVSSSDDVDAPDKTDDALQVWIAEENPVELLLLENHATTLGWKVNSVTSGVELVDGIMARVNSGRSLPDVLMVGWQMPKMDGLQALSKLAENAEYQRLPAVLVVSAQESKHIVKLETEHLADKILYKPTTGTELFNAVNHVVVKHTGDPERVIKSTCVEALNAQWLPEISILVVDDSEINLEVVEQILIKNGATVMTLNHGQAAVDQLSLTPDAFDIVLMDVQMPGMDGLETTQLIRQQLGLNRLPVVALTAGILVQEKKRALASGMNAFLTKPIEPFRLISTVRKLVGSYRSRVINVGKLISTSNVMNDNWPTILGIKDDRNLLNSDLALFVSVLERLLIEFQHFEGYSEMNTTKCEINFDRRNLAAQIHKLRGSAGLIGAQELYQLAGKAELALYSDFDEVRLLLVQLAKSITNLRLNSFEFLSKQQSITDKITTTYLQNEPSMDLDKMKELVTGLEKQELSVLSIVEEFSKSLHSILGEKTFKDFEIKLKNLNFRQALILLNSINWIFEEAPR